jgi:hypothetical protein
VFLDGAHDLALNQQTFERLLPMLAPDAIVAVHEHQPEERAFVNWVREEHPDFAQIDLHTHVVPRRGTALLQRSRPLARPPGS